MPDIVKRLVDNNRAEIVQRLGNYLSPEQFFALAYNLDRNAKIAEVAQRNPNSLIQSIMKAADCGLLIGSGFGHCSLAAFGDEIQLMVEYKGIIYQLVRAGAILTMDAKVVYDGDDIVIGLGGIEKYTPNLKDDRRRDWKWKNDKKNMLGAFARARLPLQERPGEFTYQDHWSDIGEIEHARSISKMGNNPNGAWANHYDSMALKTAVRRVTRFITVAGSTSENREAWDRFGRTMELDNSAYRNVTEELQPDDDPGATPRKSAPRRAAAGSAGSEHVTPPPQDEGRKKDSDAPSTPPPTQEVKPEPKVEPPKPPPPDEPISEVKASELLQQASSAGMKIHIFLKHVTDRYACDVTELRQSQAAELSKFIKEMAKGA